MPPPKAGDNSWGPSDGQSSLHVQGNPPQNQHWSQCLFNIPQLLFSCLRIASRNPGFKKVLEVADGQHPCLVVTIIIIIDIHDINFSDLVAGGPVW